MYPQAAPAPGKISTVLNPPKHTNYFARHWRGEISLPISFWINGLCVFYVLGLVLQGIIRIANIADFHLVIMTVVFAMLTITSLAVYVWQLVGIWRSAISYTERTRRRFWAVAAKLMCAIFVMFILYAHATISLPIFCSLASMFNGDPAMGPHVIRVLPNGTEVEFLGPITWGSAGELRKVLDDNPRIRTVHLNSQGGRSVEAESIGELIRRRGLTTYTSATCMSACTIAFLGGRERWIGPGARLGFHRGDIPGTSSKVASKVISAEIIERMTASYRRAELHEVFIKQALEVPPDRIWFPTPTQMEYAGVINGEAAPGQFVPGGFFMNIAMKEAAPYASGPDLDALAKVLIETVEKIEQADQEACRRRFNPDTAHLVDLRNYMSADLQARTLEATSWIVVARDSADADVNIPAPTPESVQPVYPLLETALRNRGTDPASVKSVLTDPSRDRQRQCWALIEYYKAILDLPTAERELFLKYKFAQ